MTDIEMHDKDPGEIEGEAGSSAVRASMEPSFETLEPVAIQSESLRRRVDLVLSWMLQTVRDFGLVAEVARDAAFADFCLGEARERQDAVERLRLSAVDAGGHPFIGLFGRLHRTWIRFVASAGDATLADELDRSDAALERATRRTLLSGATGGNPEAHRLLVALRSALEKSRHELLSSRADLDWGSESLPSARQHRRRGGSSEGDETAAGPVSKPQRRLLDLAAVSDQGEPIALGEVAGESPIVLTFISKLNRRSRKRLEGFNRRLPEFEVRDTQVVGVAKARPQQLQRVAESRDLDMPLLADPEGELAEAVDAVDGAGRPMNSTMLIDRDREVLFVSISTGRESHAAKILEAVDRYRAWFPKKMGISGDAR